MMGFLSAFMSAVPSYGKFFLCMILTASFLQGALSPGGGGEGGRYNKEKDFRLQITQV